jgi:tetratricopeptide (TPR) repeat protein
LVRKADGNPLFLEEMLRRLIETGALVRVDEQWRANTTIMGSQLPDTVQAVLAARIDALLPSQKRALQEAAVIGRIFWEQPVGRATGDADITTSLLALESKGLISVRPTSTIAGQVEIIFKHALIRDVAYASLPRVRRARAHAEAGRWLEELAAERREELAESIAHHYASALLGEDADLAWASEPPTTREELRRKALEALMLAGTVARRRYAIPKALELHQEALRLTRDAQERAGVLELIGDDHEGAFHGDDAISAWKAALAALDESGGTAAARVRILVKCAKMTGIRWGGFKVVPPISEIDAYVDAALALDPEPRDHGWLLALRAYGGARWTGVESLSALPSSDRVRSGEDARRIATDLQDVDMEVLATRALSGLAFRRGDYQGALAFARKELAIVDRIAASRDRALSLFQVAIRFMDIAGRYEEGLALAEECYRIGKELTPHEVMHANYLRMYANVCLGRWSAIDALLAEHLAAFEHEKDMTCPYVRGGLLVGATILAHRGDGDRAAETAALASTDPDAPPLPLPGALRGIFLLARGEAMEARRQAEAVLATRRSATTEEAPFELILMLDALVDMGDADGLRVFLPTAVQSRDAMALLPPAISRAEGMLELWQGNQAVAQERLELALGAYQHLGNVFEAARTHELLALVLPPDRAELARRSALESYQQLGAKRPAEGLRSLTSSPSMH